MKLTSANRGRRARAWACGVLLLAAYVSAPAVHAETTGEVVLTAHGTGHAPDCPRAHDEVLCPTCGAPQLPGGSSSHAGYRDAGSGAPCKPAASKPAPLHVPSEIQRPRAPPFR